MYLEYHTNAHLAEDAVYRVSRVSGTGIAGMVGGATGSRPQTCHPFSEETCGDPLAFPH